MTSNSVNELEIFKGQQEGKGEDDHDAFDKHPSNCQFY